MNLQEAISHLKLAVEALGQAALRDDKTPLGNAQALSLASSSVGIGNNNPDVVIFGDLNHFHNFNKLHGVELGDAAIALVGHLIAEIFVSDCKAQAFRRSGDEFVILLGRARLGQFISLVPRFSSCRLMVTEKAKKTSITRETSMSFGYALSEPEVGFGELLARAEAACRVAKREGNGTCVGWAAELGSVESMRGRCPN
jgi:diguanylate cyclase (GGDEF)-like protein